MVRKSVLSQQRGGSPVIDPLIERNKTKSARLLRKNILAEKRVGTPLSDITNLDDGRHRNTTDIDEVLNVVQTPGNEIIF
ncbi:hypothetical protein ACS0TY_016970 [Phlomoides rotata]